MFYNHIENVKHSVKHSKILNIYNKNHVMLFSKLDNLLNLVWYSIFVINIKVHVVVICKILEWAGYGTYTDCRTNGIKLLIIAFIDNSANVGARKCLCKVHSVDYYIFKLVFNATSAKFISCSSSPVVSFFKTSINLHATRYICLWFFKYNFITPEVVVSSVNMNKHIRSFVLRPRECKTVFNLSL